MPLYAYKAVNTRGDIAKGRLNAANENELAHFLRDTDLELIDARVQQNGWVARSLFRAKMPLRKVASFYLRMHDLLLSGIPFIEALRDVTATTEHKTLRDSLTLVAQSISNGGGIAASFAAHPNLIPPISVAIIAAGESSGHMTEVFAALAKHSNNSAQTQERLRRALRYPLFLFAVAGFSIGFMLVEVVPEVVQFLVGLNSELPFSTRALIAVANLVSAQDGVGFISVFAGLLILYFVYRGYQPFTTRIDGVLLKLPLLGDLLKKAALARFSTSFSLLFRSGCEAVDCIRLARGAVANLAMQAAIDEAGQRVMAGAALSTAFDRIMPPFALGLLRTGERSGDIAKSLDDIAMTYDRETQSEIDNLIGILEPSLTLMIGALLAWTVIAVLGPLYGSLSILGGRM